MSSAPILIMAGGTGGHVFPALAVARELRARNEQVVWLGTELGIEARLVPAEGIALERVRVQGLRRRGLAAWLMAPLQILLAIWEALRILRRCRPKLVLGMGGYTAGPGGLASWLLRIPLLIHEQNAVAGLTNRLLANFAREVLEAFPGSFSAGTRTRLTGNPVRHDIAALPAPDVRLDGRSGPLRLLVLGGSQGAKALNEIVAPAVALIAEAGRPEIRHQTGESTYGVAEIAYRSAGVHAHLQTFIADMAEAYGWADLVIARSGALTVAELAAAGVGAILVPYPAAVDDHQARNAAYLVDAGAATLIPQHELDAERLAAELQRHIDDRALVMQQARSARAQAKPDATADIVARCLAISMATGLARRRSDA
jgi:UDP-N-acetylglucosamine--N-acetylmuramyl-(pentapeptide) pyrophosphoryl-undecaprenol N-acetylglucosamine transferase